jgi:hypothetical protein
MAHRSLPLSCHRGIIEGLSAASQGAQNSRPNRCPRKIIHSLLVTFTAELDRKERLRTVPKRRFIRGLTSVKTLYFTAFLALFRLFVRARTVLPFFRAFTDC